MINEKPSKTAEYITFCRALETRGRPEKRLFEDPYAFPLLSLPYRVLVRIARIPMLGRVVRGVLDLGWPYSLSSAVVRTRAIDDLAAGAVRDGARQLVLLGAGFDSRGCRLDEARGIPVFEVDHPATQCVKKERLLAFMGKLPGNIRYVAMDFESDPLEAKLLEAGYDPSLPAVVVWEGVISYLTKEAVLNTLSVLSRLLAPSSLLIFTYAHKGALDGSNPFTGSLRWRSWGRLSGEPFLYGFDPGTLAETLKPRRFRLISDASTAEIAEKCCPPLGRKESGNRAYRVAVARREENP